MGWIVRVMVVFLLSIPLALAPVLMTEIRYEVPGSDIGHEWVEIFNNGTESVNLSSWKFREAGINHNLNLKRGNILLDSQQYAIIADDTTTFLFDNYFYSGTLFDSVFSLDNNGEQLSLYNGSTIVDDLNYSSSWGGNENYTLELKDISLDNNDGNNWQTSLQLNGTPGQQNSILCITSLSNTSWSDWQNQSSCLVNDTYTQTKILIQYDRNNCGQIANTTFSESQLLPCDYCVPFWTTANTTCQSSDSIVQMYSDRNDCYAQTNLTSDLESRPANLSFSCDYCVPLWTAVNSSCQFGDSIVQWYNDSRNCYAQTQLSSDLETRTENITYAHRCDYDADGFIGNGSEVNSSFTGLNVSKTANIVRFFELNNTLIEFNFTNTINLAIITMSRQDAGSSTAFLLISGLNLNNQTKTIYLDHLNPASNSVCIDDSEISSISQISASCSEVNETLLRCDGSSQNGYTCDPLDTERYKIMGLHHSGVREHVLTPVPPSNSDGSSGGGGGGASGSSVKKIVVAVVPAELRSNSILTSAEPAAARESAETNPDINIVDRVVELDLHQKSVAPSPFNKQWWAIVPAGNSSTRNSITGSVIGTVPTSSFSQTEWSAIIILSVVVVMTGITGWMMNRKR